MVECVTIGRWSRLRAERKFGASWVCILPSWPGSLCGWDILADGILILIITIIFRFAHAA